MADDYNCFDCSGLEYECEKYNEFNRGTCMWKTVAANDLIRYRKQEGPIMLEEMLREYLARDPLYRVSEALHRLKLDGDDDE